jgi:hypothetical protein
MDRTDYKMHKILCALALGFALQTGLAGDLPASREAAARSGGLMHANLVVPAQPVGAQRSAEQSALQADLEAEVDTGNKDDTKSDHTTAMLLAALALMAGIVLRRWGSSQQ